MEGGDGNELKKTKINFVSFESRLLRCVMHQPTQSIILSISYYLYELVFTIKIKHKNKNPDYVYLKN